MRSSSGSWRSLIAFLPGLLSTSLAIADVAANDRSTLTQSERSSTQLTALERAQAEHWALTPQEWQRYRLLIQGLRGSISPTTLSPIEALGIHARDATERRHFAERWAVLMLEDAERILAFQHAYDAAVTRLVGEQPLIDRMRLPTAAPRQSPLASTDRVLLFVKTECAACEAVLARLLARLDTIAGLDIYVSGLKNGDESAIRNWAVAQNVQPEWVRERKVTLNFESGALVRMVPGGVTLPYLMRRRGETVTPLAGAAL
tara:strand:- start:2024 stop:2803 length:780 start_codon:yes stop_codon:yes gene_type:complete